MKIFIQALELNLTPDELKKAIPEEKLNQLKGKGVLQAYTLAHEGVSHPKVLGEGNQVLKWPRAVIHRIAEKIKDGTKFFVGHGDNTNDHDGRRSVGEVITSFVKDIGGRLSHIIIGHFPDEQNVKDMDVCSMEADIYTDDENVVGDVNEISGIALGSSDKENPAFPGALRLGTVQCFDESRDDKKSRQKEQDMALTFEEVKKAVREMNIHPWQLFELDDIKNDRVFSKTFTEIESLRNENTQLKKDKEEVETKSKDAIRQLDITQSKDKLNTFMEDLTDKQKSFITARFKPENLEDLTDDGIKKFVENTKKEFADTAKLFGEKATETTKSGAGESEETTEENMEDEALKIMGVKPNG